MCRKVGAMENVTCDPFRLHFLFGQVVYVVRPKEKTLRNA